MWTPPGQSPSRISRRAFLGQSGLLLGGLGLFAGWEQSGAAQAPPPKAVKPIDALPWDSLRKEISGGVLRPGEAGYAAAAAPWNPRYADLLPGGIARCRTNQDVQAALFWAESQRLPLVVRSGGHSLAGYSNTRGLMLDVSAMRAVTHDPSTGQVWMEGGARVEDLKNALAPAGVAITHGRCKNLGMAGLILGGGLGMAMRRHGLTCDQLQETEMVTADGSIKICSREKNEDLFWACRGGGGGNFGVHTSFTLKTFLVADLTVFRQTWSQDLADVLPVLLSILPECDEDFGCQLSVKVRPGHVTSLEIVGQLVGGQDAFSRIFDPIHEVARPDGQSVQTLPYWDAQDLLAEKGQRELTQVRSRYVYTEFPVPAGDLVLASLGRWPGSAGHACWNVHLLGGAVDKVNRRSTAYVHRGATMLTSIELSWKSTESEQRVAANLAWLDEFHQAMEPYTSGESYQNFSDPSLGNYAQAYYAENLTYLMAIKRRLDPERTFEFTQAVPQTDDTQAGAFRY
jgi:FAD/FMN-containing dehydrogenase